MSRLPVVSSDDNAWGTILNDFLSVSLNTDGTLKNLVTNVATAGADPTGTVDCTTVLQSLFTNAVRYQVFYFPPGSYGISAPLTLDVSNVTLLGFGQRNGAPTIFIKSGDPSYALIVGNTVSCDDVTIQGIFFQGPNSTATTGGGVNLRGIGNIMKQSKVAQFGGTGVNITAFTGSIFEVFLEDVALGENGKNTTTPGDNLVISGSVSDSEYHRVITYGVQALTSSRYGINNSGISQKFIACHAYFCTDGFHQGAGTGYTEIIGGEWENCTNGINISAGSKNVFQSLQCFGNTNYDIALASSDYDVIQGNAFVSTASHKVGLFSSTRAVIADNVFSPACANAALILDSASGKCHVHDNVIDSSTDAINIAATNCDVHDNMIVTGNVTEATGANTNSFHDNYVVGVSFTKIGAASVFKNNRGYNPVGQVTAPTFPATTVAATNTTGVDVTAYITNGTAAITVIQIAGQGGTYVTTGQQIAASTWGNIRIPAGGGVKFTYASGSPTWVWMGD